MPLENGFKELTRLDDALEDFLKKLNPINRSGIISIEKGKQRVLGKDIIADRNIPHFDRAAMDGFAVRAEDTFGATQSSPVLFNVNDSVGLKKCKRISTGSPVPKNANAIVKIEDAESKNGKVKIFESVSPLENVSEAGEDIKKGEEVFRRGHQLRNEDIGLLRMLGIEDIKVFDKPKVGIIPTGEEVIPPGSKPDKGEVIESNSIILKLMVKQWGGVPFIEEIIEDNPSKIGEAIKSNLKKDIITLIGGSSVGDRDHAYEVIDDIGTIYTHGTAIKPGKPVILGEAEDTPILGLPGYPAANIITSILFLRPVLRKIGRMKQKPMRTIGAKLDQKIHSPLGFKTYTRVKVEDGIAKHIRTSGSGVLSSITKSDGFIVIDEDTEGLNPGSLVEVNLFE